MPPKARWTATPAKAVMGPDGTMSVTVQMADAGRAAYDVTLTLTADRVLRTDIVRLPGAAPLTGQESWLRED